MYISRFNYIDSFLKSLDHSTLICSSIKPCYIILKMFNITCILNYLKVYFIRFEDLNFFKFISQKAHLFQNKFNLPYAISNKKDSN